MSAGTGQRHLLGLALATMLTVGFAAEAAASPLIHAHRAGPLATVDGRQIAALPEETLAGYEQRATEGYVLEVDVKLTGDRVPVTIHDGTLDRTTDCSGGIGSYTAAELRAQCEVDVVGTNLITEPLAEGDPRREPVPTLAEFLALAIEHRASVNLEIKNLPIDSDFDPGVPPAYAETIAAEIERSGFPPERLIVQSFYPPNLDVIEDDPYFAGAATSLLTLAPANEIGPELAVANGYEWVSPGWPVVAPYVERAHSLGLLVAPYTIDDAAGIAAAADLGVDAVITNDPALAASVIGPGGEAGACGEVQRGDAGDDPLRGGPGSDELRGAAGDDRLRGADGNDCLHGARGRDHLRGQRGADRLVGGRGRDMVRGGAGADEIEGSPGSDRLHGGGGADAIAGGSGRDVIDGSGGDDEIDARGGGRDRIRCGAGADTVHVEKGRDRVSRDCERVIRR